MNTNNGGNKDPREYFARHPILGPAYPPIFKAMATALMMAIVFYAYRALEAHAATLTPQLRLLFAGGGLTVLFSYYGLLRSQTRIDGEGVEQSMMFKHPVDWDAIVAARFDRSPVAARLSLRTRAGKSVVFHAGSEELSFAFEAIARLYPTA